MADSDDNLDGDITTAQEELTVQKVILDSLDSVSFDGVEEERLEARKEIARLTAYVAKAEARRSAQSEPHSLSHLARDADQAASGPSASNQRTPGRGSLHNPSASSRHGSTAMSTPPRGEGFWSPNNSRTLPSRKRELDPAAVDDGDTRNKSRRTTPTPTRPQDDPFSASSTRRVHSFGTGMYDGELDIIDLTGDDVEEPAAAVVAQLRVDRRREQEKQDRIFALQLSSQGSRPASPANGTLETEPRTDVFNKLMGTQRSNAPPQRQGSLGQGRQLPNSDVTWSTAAPLPPSAPSMPGAYHDAWDDPFGSRSISQPFTPRQPSGHSARSGRENSGPAGTLGSNASPMRHTPPVSGRPRHPQFPGQNGSPYPRGNLSSSGSPAPALNGFNSSAALLHGPPSIPGLPNHDPLAHIINRTSRVDYMNGLDANGDSLPQRLNDFFQDAVHDPRVTDKELDDLLQNIRPDMDIPEKNRAGTPAGLKSALYPHQEVALTWMKQMEDGSNKGGILADDMGLGKTISTLALMLERPNTSRPKTNLIVGPLSLIRQWEEEIKKKTKLSHRLSVFVYHNCRATVEDLFGYDVVLTTYGTLAAELKRLNKFMSDNNSRNIDFNNDVTLKRKCPLLHPTKSIFHRVILDEAQCIKNKLTKTAAACYKLKATYRWCLTGTPMMNGVVELYSLLHFLQIKPYCHWDKFSASFGQLMGKAGDPKHVAMSRLRATLKACMLRRKKNSMLDGKPILRLPDKTEEPQQAKLSQDERNFYDQLEKKSQVLFSKYLREGTIGKNYSNILVLLLRLRQACCHPHLNLDVDDVGAATDPAVLEKVRQLDPIIVNRIKAAEAFECPICYDAVQSPSFIDPCGHDTCKPCLARVADNAATQNLLEGDENSQAKCPVCRGPLDASKCFSYEAFRTIHMPETFEEAEDTDADLSDDEDWDNPDADYDDGDVDSKGNLKGFIDDSDADEEDEDRKPTWVQVKKPVKDEIDDDYVERKPTGEDMKPTAEDLKPKADIKDKKIPGKKRKGDIKPSMLKTLRQEAKKNRKAYNKYMSYLRRTWLPSAKVTECMNLLKEIQKTGEKTIIFSQWTLLLDLLDVAMHHGQFDNKPVRYDGSMSATQRNVAATDFRENKNAKVMLVSLRAGNAGLNLTAASRVIIMDPFWNPYIEMQAIDRAYRIGQQKNVKVHRILTQETVEDRIVALQEKKKEIVEAALDESESMKIGRLTVGELKFLFKTS